MCSFVYIYDVYSVKTEVKQIRYNLFRGLGFVLAIGRLHHLLALIVNMLINLYFIFLCSVFLLSGVKQIGYHLNFSQNTGDFRLDCAIFQRQFSNWKL